MKAAVKHKFGQESFSGLKVAVQGMGNVGRYVCKNLVEAGAKLIVADVNPKAVDRAIEEFGAKAVAPDKIYAQEVDIFSPCAMGGILNDNTIGQLKASIVAGVANNQLAEARHGQLLHDKGILYAPDYVINAGGMLNASGDIFRRYDIDEVLTRVTALFDTTLRIFEIAERENRPTHEVADDLAREKIAAGKV